MTQLCLIAARARNGVIGHNNTLPWRLPDDLKHFKTLTLGHPVIMGRKTWESLGRPLPGRLNIVITHNLAYDAPGAQVAPALDAALRLCEASDRAFVIGGGELYALAQPLAHWLYLTEVDGEVEGDAHFPPLLPGHWRETERRHHGADEQHQWPFDFVTYQALTKE